MRKNSNDPIIAEIASDPGEESAELSTRPVVRHHAPRFLARFLLPYLDLLRARKIPVQQLLAKYGLHRVNLAEPFEYVPTASFLAITHDVAKLVNDPHVGLRLGYSAKPEDTAPFGLLMICADTLREALVSIAGSLGAFQERIEMRLATDNPDNSSLIYRLQDYDAVTARHEIEYSLSAICSLIRNRLGSDWSPIEIHFEHAKVGLLSFYEGMFNSAVFFEQPVSKIILSNSDLNRVNISARGGMMHFLRKHLESLQVEMDQAEDLLRKVALIVAKGLADRQCSLKTVATQLNMSVRSMQRHLAEGGTSYQEIVRQERQRMATTLMKSKQRITMASIAVTLGYADETSLSRAFRKWTGDSPRSYSRKRRSDDAEAESATVALPTRR